MYTDISVLFVKRVELVSRLEVCTQVSIRPPNPITDWTGAVRKTGFDASSELPSCFFCLTQTHTGTHTHAHKASMFVWPLTLTLLFLCSLAETGPGGGAASEGTCVARWSEGKVGTPLLSSTVVPVSFPSKLVYLSFCLLPFCVPLSFWIELISLHFLVTPKWQCDQHHRDNQYELIIVK